MILDQFKKALTRPDEPWKDEERHFWVWLRDSGLLVKSSLSARFDGRYFEYAVQEITDWPEGRLEELYARWQIEREI